MESFSGPSTRKLRTAAVLFTLVLLAPAAVCSAADAKSDEKKQTSSFFGLRKPKKAPVEPAVQSKKLAAENPVNMELTEEEKKLVAEAARKAAERAASGKEPVKLPAATTFVVQPRRPIWTPVLPAPPKSLSDPNKAYKPYVPQAPTRYMAIEPKTDTAAPKNPTASPITPGNKKR